MLCDFVAKRNCRVGIWHPRSNLGSLRPAQSRFCGVSKLQRSIFRSQVAALTIGHAFLSVERRQELVTGAYSLGVGLPKFTSSSTSSDISSNSSKSSEKKVRTATTTTTMTPTTSSSSTTPTTTKGYPKLTRLLGQ